MIMEENLNVWPDPDFHQVSHKDSAGELWHVIIRALIVSFTSDLLLFLIEN